MMNKLQRLTEEIRNLSSGELAVLRAWFEDFDSIDSRRRVDAYLSTAPIADAGTVKPDEGKTEKTDDKTSNECAPMEMAACMREAYRQLAFQEYAQLVAADLGLTGTLGLAHE